ncbi:MAG: hypothetical protein H7287_08150 [Thermoleophilia bacterium]|nr:hypothetical protein [Thermoleophilia bacterium]
MKFARIAICISVAALLAPIASAQAAPTAVTPAFGSTVRTVAPLFTFAPAAGESYDLFRLSRSPKVDAQGWLLRGNDTVIADGDVTGTSYRLPTGTRLDHGVYYWQVMGFGTDAAGQQVQVQSPATKFGVAALLNFAGVRVKLETNPASGRPEAAFYGKVRGNLTGSCKITLVVKRGTKVVYRQPRQQDCNGYTYVNTFLNWPNGTIKRGTPVTATLVLAGGGSSITSNVLAFKAP